VVSPIGWHGSDNAKFKRADASRCFISKYRSRQQGALVVTQRITVLMDTRNTPQTSSTQYDCIGEIGQRYVLNIIYATLLHQDNRYKG
jgi:hypothetical protein